MFVDASALVAILRRESGFEALAGRLDRADNAITSPVAVLEAVMSLGKQKSLPVGEAREAVFGLLTRSGIDVAVMDEATSDLAIQAHAKFGKGSGHPACLNLGNCFAYAMARQHNVPLLYKGDDFSHTDLPDTLI
jgi:ribonuclease VapC